MPSFADSTNEYKRQLRKGEIQIAYRGLMVFIRSLRLYFVRSHPEISVPSNIYYGYMDMTSIALIPESLARRRLKISIVFLHEPFRFEVWLSGMNREVQAKTWEMIQERGWNKYHLANDPRAVDYVIDHVLVEDPQFADLEALTREIEKGTLAFIDDVEAFLEGG